MKRAFLALCLLVVVGGVSRAQAPVVAPDPKVIEDIDTKYLTTLFKIIRTDYDPAARQVTWLLESKTAQIYPRVIARFFDADDVEYATKFLEFQHGQRAVGERTRAFFVLPVDPEVMAKAKRIQINLPVSAREPAAGGFTGTNLEANRSR